MTKRKVTNRAASVKNRLLTLSKSEGRSYEELLQYYAIERFLYRLSLSRHADRFILKGALMLQFWGVPLIRATRDIDFMSARTSSVDHLVEILRECLAAQVDDDGLRFDGDSVRGEEIRIEADYNGVRLHLLAFLEQTKINLQIDVGFGDVITPGASKISYPSLLGFEEPRLLGYTPETTIAEKFQAMVVLDMANSRMKDFFDLWLLATNRDFSGVILAEAIRSTFTRRKTNLPSEIPIALTSAFTDREAKQIQWRSYLQKAKVKGKPPTLKEAIETITVFVMPVVEALIKGQRFDRRWLPGGPWGDPP